MRTTFLILTAVAGTASANTELRVDDGQIDGRQLQPYDITWRQCSVGQDGTWVASHDLTERMVVVGEHVLRIQQLSERPDGGKGVGTTYLDRDSMAPLRLEQLITAADGSVVGVVVGIR